MLTISSPVTADSHHIVKLAVHNPVVVQELHHPMRTSPFPL